MSRIGAFIDRLGRARPGKAARNGDESRPFSAYYHAFRELLHYNHVALKTMGDMQEKVGGEYLFDRAYVRSACRQILGAIEHIIGRLNVLSDNRHTELIVPFQRCAAEIRSRIDPKIDIPDGPFAVPLESVTGDDLPSVGGKCARLGEIARIPTLAVPAGFAITTAAFSAFMDHNRIGEAVEGELRRLDIRDYEALQDTAERLQKKVFAAEVPPKVAAAVDRAFSDLSRMSGKPDLRVAVRSSALQEDLMASFAGQYGTRLNVSFEELLSAYKGILVSLFSPRALFYFRDKGFRIDNMAMAVAVVAMVDARTSGVFYSRDPAAIDKDRVLVSAVFGLGPYAVDGTVTPDFYELRPGGKPEVRTRESGGQQRMLVCDADQGLREKPVPQSDAGRRCLDKDRIRALGKIARHLETVFGGPQDAEWAEDGDGRIFLLQSRPLVAEGPAPAAPGAKRRIKGPRVLLEEGNVVCRGAASGRATVVSNSEDAAGFAEGDVLVVRHSHPEYAALLKKAAALVSDVGAPLGHLAAVAREYRVPALFNTKKATGVLESGTTVTVDATYATIYEGRVEEVLGRPIDTDNRQAPAVKQLKDILAFISPLRLTDPRSPGFTPAGCRTLHDITRFCHEAALDAMFARARRGRFSASAARQLTAEVPLKWWVVDLGGGIRKGARGRTVSVKDLTCAPMRALWKGMTAVAWKGPPPVDTRGFLSAVLGAMTRPETEPAVGGGMADRNYILAAADFVNVSTRLGFHFSTVESLIGDTDDQHYISFVFTGGGADDGRKRRRVQLIQRLLERFDFRVEAGGETVFARFAAQPREMIESRLQVLGHILVHTRQMDMVMYNDKMVDWYYREMARDIASHVREDSR